MTEKEAAIIMAYTGIVLGNMSYFHHYAEELLGRSIFTHEFASQHLMRELKQKSYEDFINLKIIPEFS